MGFSSDSRNFITFQEFGMLYWILAIDTHSIHQFSTNANQFNISVNGFTNLGLHCQMNNFINIYIG